MQNFSGNVKLLQVNAKFVREMQNFCKQIQHFMGERKSFVRERKNIKIQFFLQPHIIPDMKVLQSNQVERHKSTEIFPPNLIFYHHHIPYRKVVNLDVI